MPIKVCFYTPVPDKAMLERIEFYAQDVQILRDLRFDVTLTTRASELRRADLYFIWWWTWAFIPLTVARTLGRPALITGTFGHVYEDGTWDVDRRPWSQRRLLAYALRHADANVFVSQLELREVSARFNVRGAYYSPHTVDTTAYSPGRRPREDFFLTVAWLHARNAARKCIPELIRAAALVRERHSGIRFLIAGEKESGYPELQALACRLGVADCVEFLGVISRERKIELMRRCRAYLQPTRSEGFGLATLEAMSCGAPIITSPNGAVPEVVGDAGYMVDGTNPTAIASAIERLLVDAATLDDLGSRARERACRLFPYERRKDELEAIIQRLLAKRSGRARSAEGTLS